MGDYRVIVSREKHWVYAARRYNVELDGFSIGELRNGSVLSANTTPGVHTFAIKSLLGNELKSVKLNITEAVPVQEIDVNLAFWTGKPELILKSMAASDAFGKEKAVSQEVPPEAPVKGKIGRVKAIALWILTIWFALSACAFFPSVTSLLFALCAILLLPISKVQNFFGENHIRGAVKVVSVIGLIVVAALFIHNRTKSTTNSQLDIQSTIEQSIQDENDFSAVESQSSEQEVAESVNASSVSPYFVVTDFDGDGYERVYADLLYEYGQYMAGRKVVTVIKATSNSTNRDSTIYANTENDEHSIRFSIGCNLVNELSKDDIQAEDLVTIAGTIAEKHGIGVTTTLNDCYIIGMGEIAQDIKNAQEYQRSICERYKKDYEDAIVAELQAEVDSYIGDCVTVSYSDVERNPDSYKGKKVKVSGTVAQVIEGWFDGVTLRLTSDADGNDWYISYTHKEGESRILENDHITAYGECDGVQNVTNLLGAQLTLPRMNMKYFR